MSETIPLDDPEAQAFDLRRVAAGEQELPTWGKVVDQTLCIGCHACTTACKSENDVPVGVNRTYVKNVEIGTFPGVRRAFQVTRCNQCVDAPCVAACPTAAMFKRGDGIVDFDKSACIGCKACMAACPYDAIFINPDDHSAEKCNFCVHRLEVGLEPACVVVCPTDAIIIGDLKDPASKVAQTARAGSTSVRRPEKHTSPTLFYKGAHQATLDPLAARRPEGGLFAWSEQAPGANAVVSGNPQSGSSSAAALLAYDVPHAVPWDWRVSLYTWLKAIAAGAYLAPLLLLISGVLSWTSSVWLWAAPGIALGFLAATGGALIADLEHPRRFYYLLVRPQWRSWLVRGAVVIGAYGAVLVAHLALSATGATSPQKWLAVIGGPAAAAAAAYTAFLFAQARGRDLWQSSLLAPHMLLQSVLAGAAAMIPVAAWLAPSASGAFEWMLTAAVAGHLLAVGAELYTSHPTTHARLAAHELFRGRYAPVVWLSVALAAVALLAPVIGVAAAACALVALLLYEHAYVQAGQAVPLA